MGHTHTKHGSTPVSAHPAFYRTMLKPAAAAGTAPGLAPRGVI